MRRGLVRATHTRPVPQVRSGISVAIGCPRRFLSRLLHVAVALSASPDATVDAMTEIKITKEEGQKSGMKKNEVRSAKLLRRKSCTFAKAFEREETRITIYVSTLTVAPMISMALVVTI